MSLIGDSDYSVLPGAQGNKESRWLTKDCLWCLKRDMHRVTDFRKYLMPDVTTDKGRCLADYYRISS